MASFGYSSSFFSGKVDLIVVTRALRCNHSLSACSARQEGDTIIVDSPVDLSYEQNVELDTLMQETDGVVLTLEELKEELIARVDQKTRASIAEGFSFGGERFSLSLAAQSTINGLASLLVLSPALTDECPIVVSTLDSKRYELLSAKEVMDFIYESGATLRRCLQAGNAEKSEILRATRPEELLFRE